MKFVNVELNYLHCDFSCILLDIFNEFISKTWFSRIPSTGLSISTHMMHYTSIWTSALLNHINILFHIFYVYMIASYCWYHPMVCVEVSFLILAEYCITVVCSQPGLYNLYVHHKIKSIFFTINIVLYFAFPGICW